MDDVQDQTPRQLQREARKRATIKAGRNAGMLKAVAYRFRDPELDVDWCHAPADDFDPELMKEKGWEVQPLVVLEDDDEK